MTPDKTAINEAISMLHRASVSDTAVLTSDLRAVCKEAAQLIQFAYGKAPRPGDAREAHHDRHP